MSIPKRYREGDLLTTPRALQTEFPVPETCKTHIHTHATAIRDILARKDKRKLLVIGPCSLHDYDAAIDYAKRLKTLADQTSDQFLILMRTYFEKPRTTVGWKGWISDVDLNEQYDLNAGYRRARELLLAICQIGLPTATEIIHPATVAYLSDLLSWSCIGARTSESQMHRELASGLSIPVAFKNSTTGSVNTAINAMQATANPHTYVSCDSNAQLCHIHTTGNALTHLVLRGGSTGTNYHAEAVATATEQMRSRGLTPNVMIDCSHGNSQKQPSRVPAVFDDVINQICTGNNDIIGIMFESHLVEGRQDIPDDLSTLTYGQSITDPCLNWETTEKLVLDAHQRLT